MTSPTAPEKNLPKTILLTGLFAGTLDILSALTHAYLRSGTSPVQVFKYIASGIFGTEAFSGGTGMVICGLVTHYLIALSWTTLFFLVYPKLTFLSKNKVVSGILYGIFVWAMMGFVVLPLTSTPKFPFNPVQAAIGCLILILMIGTPISFSANRYYSNK